jgi:anti-anti-sigma regulatory factor
MPACHVAREERSGRVIYSLRGRLDGATAWDLCNRLQNERRSAVLVDFSQVEDFADYGVFVLAQAMSGPRGPRHTGLRQHTLRLFEYLGVDLQASRTDDSAGAGDFDEADQQARDVREGSRKRGQAPHPETPASRNR